ncbi:anhydro-N-acetylmuramic acid kinase [Flavobacteriaceae bacterium XHP0103]|uniref:anhydro-N-acetylmuramic acid kinase n=1 Tax=Marixanthotalea marina TaxID=2844359 RepID=UPI002989DEAB|nr:anhydro-N-acetylmuramic acid kinase [Marixanthotalea marina]MBU3823079.1 anhydro-N-acetylmuramic acid kinase [Marixanthotalea marina]
MIKSEYKVIGVMSGTSLDGIDLVYAKFEKKAKWHFDILVAETYNYDNTWRENLKKLVSYSHHQLDKTDNDYTEYLAHVINRFIEKNKITEIDAVCSHGHTALHRPESRLTYQIGNKPFLANLIGNVVVCDFRVQDVELGGQGAPLVPIGDKLLFSEYDFCLNLGGFANISTDIDNERIAYDICPANIVLNHYMKFLEEEYDDDGIEASKGNINTFLLESLNGLKFYESTHPKSLGLEWVASEVFPLIDSFKIDLQDILRTFVEHIAIQISKEINKKNNASVLVSGGGVYNGFLIKRLESLTHNKIVIPSKNIIEFKEALIFAFLGVLKLRNEVNTLKSVTGAIKDHSSGVVYPS